MTNVYFSLPVLHHDSFSYTQQPAPASQVNNSKSWVPQRILIIVPHHLGKKVETHALCDAFGFYPNYYISSNIRVLRIQMRQYQLLPFLLLYLWSKQSYFPLWLLLGPNTAHVLWSCCLLCSSSGFLEVLHQLHWCTVTMQVTDGLILHGFDSKGANINFPCDATSGALSSVRNQEDPGTFGQARWSLETLNCEVATALPIKIF